jgi:ectoine hydroxylase-related dioxygenase (phytanoyl-CoA dioxygenase family)
LNIADGVARDGFAIVPDVLTPEEVAALRTVAANADWARSTRGNDVFGARNILAVAEIAALARAPAVMTIVRACIGANARPVRGIFFDKTPGANWPVAWHQDLTLAVAEKHDVDGWTRWSVKSGVHHVQPPVEVLERMITLRIHLDDNDAENGPLKVLPGSHGLGRIAGERIAGLRVEMQEQTCLADAGSVLAMKPLILHASSAAKSPRHRRTVHIEYAPEGLLPAPLRWTH